MNAPRAARPAAAAVHHTRLPAPALRDVPAGVYAVTATRALDEAEAFALTGHRRAVTLTARPS